MRVWKNTGGGGTKLVADGNKYCNMMGHRDGRADYVWTQSTGEMSLFINRGKGTINDKDAEGYWDPSPGVIFRPPRQMDRRDLHLQDWDGDGDCDIIYVNPETNAVEVFINQHPNTGKWEWTHLTDPAPGLSCGHKRSLAISDLAVRFADLTDNNRADYLCLGPDSHVSGYLQQDNAAFADADVDGDGKDDMLWIEKFSGDTWVWYNGGRGLPSTGGGSSFYWRVQDRMAYYGLVAGTCIYYADLDGNGHADEHYVMGTFNNEAKTSLNQACGLTDRTGDDGPITDPKLPVQPGTPEDDENAGGQDYEHPPYTPNPKHDMPNPSCPDGDKYTTIEQLEANAGLIDLWCGPQYSIRILLRILQDSLARYDEIMSDGYDKYFKIYAEYLVDNSWSALRNYMYDHGDEFFTCKIVEEVACCTTCELLHVSCNFCMDPCSVKGPTDDTREFRNTTQPCPPDYSKGMGKDELKTIYWTIRENRAEEFWANVVAETGAPRDKMGLEKLQGIGTLSPSCAQDSANNGEDGMKPSCYYRNYWFNAPKIHDFKTEDITNPKNILNKALDDTKPLADQLTASLFELQVGAGETEPEDIVDAVSLSDLMMEESLDYMETVVEMGKELEEAAKKTFILNLLSAIFAVVSTGGSTLASVGLTSLGRAFVIIGEGAGIGLGIYDMVQTPCAIPLDLFGIVMSGKGIRDVGNVRKAAKVRRSMDRVSIERMSKRVAEQTERLKLVVEKNARAPDVCVKYA